VLGRNPDAQLVKDLATREAVRSPWWTARLENLFGASQYHGMASTIWTTEYFSCPNCGLPYTATREQHATRHTGSFSCEVCGVKVHVWSGNYDFFDWQVDKPNSPMFGKRWA